MPELPQNVTMLAATLSLLTGQEDYEPSHRSLGRAKKKETSCELGWDCSAIPPFPRTSQQNKK